ncbi:MAG: RHS repeat-associated core domain-containing protein, partial [Bacteroidota bacterium]
NSTTDTYTDFGFLFQNNATRVTVNANSYEVQLLYPEGYVFFRLRSARDKAAGWREFGHWTSDKGVNQTLKNFPDKIKVDWHQNNELNWKASTLFAEEGKNVPSITYYDGSLRNRQEILRSSVIDRSIVSEMIYDHHGRVAVNVLPTPSEQSTMQYHPLFSAKPNGQPLTKADFDLGACSLPPIMLDTMMGASKYFSGANPKSNQSYHQYLPNAKGFPYGVVEYTPDLTGRMRRQGGVGPDFQLGSGRETRFLYGKPTQEELDRLFGNDVGHYSHYLKSATIDANGQAAISYMDSHGRTIATALAGSKPDNVNQIDEGFENVSSVNSSLLDNREEELALVSTHKIIIVAPGAQTFNYSIGPDDFRKDCLPSEICYDCLYDLTITLSDNDCNAFNGGDSLVITKSNFSFAEGLDTLCSGTNSGGSIDTSFTLILPVGEYTVTKKLKVSEESLDYYTDHFMTQTSCMPILQDLIGNFVNSIDSSGCGLSCEDCVSSLGGEAAFIANLQALATEAGETISFADAQAAYQRRVAECEEMCFEPTECQVILQSMLADVSPGGQYALFEPDTVLNTIVAGDSASIFFQNKYQSLPGGIIYRDENGQPDTVINIAGQPVLPSQLGPNEFLANWQPSWANSLVEACHPEYCLYDQWCINNGLDTFDYCDLLSGVDTWQEAFDNNYADSTGVINDPFFMPGGAGYDCVSLRDSLLDSLLLGISVVEFVTTQVYGCITVLGGGTTSENDLAWTIYRRIYCGIRQQLIQQKRGDIDCSPILECIGDSTLTSCNGMNGNIYRYKKRRFPEYQPTQYTLPQLQELADSISGEIVLACEETCENNVEVWLMQLQGCDLTTNLSSSELTALRNRLIAVCQSGCDQDHPFGASTTPTGITTAFGDTSFMQIIEHFLPVVSGDCELDCAPLSITSMRPYDKPLYDGPETRISLSNTCICENLSDLQSCYNDLPSGSYSSFAQYLSQFSETRLTSSDLDTLLLYCNPSSSPILPGAYVIPPYLECNVCKDCAEMTSLKTEFNAICSTNDPNYDDLLARYLNNELGFGLDWFDYKSFFDSCSMSSACPESLILCPDVGEVIDSSLVDECYNSLVMQAEVNAALALQTILDSLRQDFRLSYIKDCLDNDTEDFNADLLNQEYHYTLYYFDQAGNLAQTVPPNGVHPIMDADSLEDVKKYRDGLWPFPIYPNHSYLTKYVYNSLGQIVRKVGPDIDQVRMWYDRLGRVVVSQDGRQVADQLFSYTKYDNLGRVIEVGEKQDPSVSYSQLTSWVFNDNLLQTWINSGAAENRRHVTRTYYDEAEFQVSAFDNSEQLNLRNRVASKTVEAVNDNDEDTYDYATHFSYDATGNARTMVQEIVALHPYDHGYKRVDYDYDYISGNLNAVHYQKGKDDQFTHRYEYDDLNRLTDVFTSLIETGEEGLLWDRDAKYLYYDHGPMARAEIGHYNVQGMDYAYTLQGWTKGVNSGALVPERDMGRDGSLQPDGRSTVARDALAYTLGYFDGAYKPIGGQSIEPGLTGSSLGATNNLYNGNIRYMSIHNKQFGEPIAFSYNYDQLHRIKDMQSHHNADLTTFNWGSNNSPQYSMSAVYDGNGNIQDLSRNGLLLGTTLSAPLNQLDYAYEAGTNKLINTTENASQCMVDIDVVDPIGQDVDLFASNNITASSELGSGVEILFQGDNCVDLQPGFDVIASAEGDFEAVNGACPPPTPVTATYDYDGTGNLISSTDAKYIRWSPYHRVTEVKLRNAPIKTLFGYDPDQNRVMKAMVDTITNDTMFTYYIRSAAKNQLAVYSRKGDTVRWSEQYIFGDARLGSLNPNVEWNGTTPFADAPYFSNNKFLNEGWKYYEFSNHLGNVLATINDRKIKVDNDDDQQADYYEPTIISALDYYPFGLEMPGRSYQSGNYRMGFNGMEMDRNKEFGDLISYYSFHRIYNPVLGRWLSPDPKAMLQPGLSPYAAMNNNPIMLNDPNGDIAPAIWAIIVAAIEAGGQTAVDAILGTAIGLLTGQPYTAWAVAGDFLTNLVPGWGEMRTVRKFQKIVKVVDNIRDAIKSSKAIHGLDDAVKHLKGQFDAVQDAFMAGNMGKVKEQTRALLGKIFELRLAKDLDNVHSTGLNPLNVMKELGLDQSIAKKYGHISDIDIVQKVGNKIIVGEAKSGAKFLKLKTIYKDGELSKAGKQLEDRIKFTKDIQDTSKGPAEFTLHISDDMSESFKKELIDLGQSHGVKVNIEVLKID